jgi:hypothetical protein
VFPSFAVYSGKQAGLMWVEERNRSRGRLLPHGQYSF